MLKIWGRANSINVQKALWCADELGLAYERTDIGGPFGGNKEPAYLKLNPNGLVPTIEDDGFVLWESNTVVRYLSAKHGLGSLCPADIRARADVERWMDWQLSTINPGMTQIFWGWIRTPPEKRDLAAMEAARVSLSELWARLDGHLRDRAFVGGGAFTMGDIPVGALAYRWFNLPIERPNLPALKAWYERLATRPAYAKNVMIKMT
ncbi:MAG TPA: glutathione S-transferase [Candidatus Cybelea sp.]|nr:glutathione S-transferase [Candidatus Cybelea sp.]